MRYIKVFAPGTVANLGCGFDVMGLTLDGVGDLLEVGIEEGAGGLVIRNRSGKELPAKNEDNVITPAVMALLGAYEKPVRVEVTILEKIAPGSGIGSSAASSAAAVWGVNELLGRPFSGERLVEFAMMGEALIGGTSHADNVGPAVLGGVVLIRGYEPLDIVRLPVPEGFFYAVVHPDIVVSTKQAREVLPREVPLHDAVTQWGNVGGLVAGFALGDVALIGRSMHDVVAEPYRKGFIPGYDVLKEGVLAEGALAMNIAGSGPSIFALAADEAVAQRVAQRMRAHFARPGIGCKIYAGRVSNCGARIVGRHQLDLHGPLAQLAGGRRRGALPCLGGVQGLGHAARADVHRLGRTAGAAGRVGGLVLPGGLHGGLVVGRGLALLKRDGPRGAVWQAVAHAVAVVVAHQRGLAADHGNRALVAGGGAGPAAVAFLLVDVNDLSFHGQPP